MSRQICASGGALAVDVLSGAVMLSGDGEKTRRVGSISSMIYSIMSVSVACKIQLNDSSQHNQDKCSYLFKSTTSNGEQS